MLQKINPDLNFIDLQDALIGMEYCLNCLKKNNNCNDKESCKDIFNFLLNISKHFQQLRTLIRRLYEIRALNLWLMEIDNIFEYGKLIELKQMLLHDPLKVYTIN